MKKQLKEGPQGISNKTTSDLQECLTELDGLTNLINDLEEHFTYNIDDTSTEKTKLEYMKQKVSFISNVINSLVALETTESADEPSNDLTEDNNPAVNMDIDNVVKNPDDVKKLDDKHIDVNVTDKDGNAIIEAKKIAKKVLQELKAKGLLNEKAIQKHLTESRKYVNMTLDLSPEQYYEGGRQTFPKNLVLKLDLVAVGKAARKVNSAARRGDEDTILDAMQEFDEIFATAVKRTLATINPKITKIDYEVDGRDDENFFIMTLKAPIEAAQTLQKLGFEID